MAVIWAYTDYCINIRIECITKTGRDITLPVFVSGLPQERIPVPHVKFPGFKFPVAGK
jgi:hypothetical protein